MAEIVLTAFNARFSHPSMGLRALLANLGPLRPQTALLEFDLETRPEEALEAVLHLNPRIIGCGVYIWNTALVTRFATLLKTIRPEIKLVLGGPEASHALDHHPLGELADHRVVGEGELIFPDICHALLHGHPPLARKILAPPPDLATVQFPHDEYSAHDLAHRHLYVESSRGCPYRCSFCLSALDHKVRRFPIPRLLTALESLIARGGRHFKFVDRTFNLGEEHATAILDFFLERIQIPGLFIHFEMVPDRLTAGLQERLAAFPPGSLQLEIGIQSFNPQVLQAIDRHQDNGRAEENLRWLLTSTQAHIHTDLIVGLPQESLESLAQGFDRLIAIGPHEIQVGILKRLAGTPLCSSSASEAMRFDPHPPYELLENRQLDFLTMRRLKRFARYWDLVGNSGRFTHALRAIFSHHPPFATFLAFSDRLHAVSGQTHRIALPRLAMLVKECFLPLLDAREQARFTSALEHDQANWHAKSQKHPDSHPPPRQQRHLSHHPETAQ
ncbi:MAG: B12-binding domain-containing radical SAM protein [Magnetococcales bacterium]|nr:B12-binding domain-containing radical SAM protein [Magnetococcales bacterium]NGZ06749.1 B12-binding domain-containing radical SAM protein [Magnetococcales bacterium]